MGGRGKSSYGYQLDMDSQGKHIPGHRNYIPGRSTIDVSPERLKELFNEHRGKGEIEKSGREGRREVIDFGEVIGKVFNKETGQWENTVWGKIHYKKDGRWHMVPSKPIVK